MPIAANVAPKLPVHLMLDLSSTPVCKQHPSPQKTLALALEVKTYITCAHLMLLGKGGIAGHRDCEPVPLKSHQLHFLLNSNKMDKLNSLIPMTIVGAPA